MGRLRRPTARTTPGPGAGARRSWRVAALAVVVVLLLPVAPSAALTHSSPSRGPRTDLAREAPLAPHPGLRAGAHPTQSGDWYTQEGATLAQWDDSYTLSVVPSLRLTLTLAPSGVPTGYELNGLSDGGDWYQLVVAYDWPGCNNGFEEVTEVWTSAGASGAVNCDPTLALHSGDSIELNLTVASSNSVCMGVTDRTTRMSHPNCISPPDSPTTGFTALSSTSDSNGYFTGPMTEMVNQSASSCPDYSTLPTIAYSFLAPVWVSAFLPWADEFESGGSGTYCFGGSPGTEGVGAGDPTTYYFDSASGTGFRSRWGAAQNDSIRVPGTTFRYQTDPVLLASVSASATSLLLAIGGSTTLTAVVGGGVAPYGALWSENGSFVPNRNLSWTWNATSAGVTTFLAYGVDAQGDVVGPSNPVAVDIPGPLAVSRVFVSPRSGALDVGQTLNLSVTAEGGVAPYDYIWSGLPSGCPANDAPVITCQPNASGYSAIELQLIDSNHTTVGSPTLVYQVVSDPQATDRIAPTTVEVGRTLDLSGQANGGAPPLGFTWSGVPPGCSGSTSSIQCVPTGAGQFEVGLTVSDANGFALRLPAILLVVDPKLVVTVAPSHSFADVGEGVRLTAVVTGGGGGYTFAWTGLPVGCMPVNASNLLCSATAPGTSTIGLTVTDGLGGAASAPSLVLPISGALTVDLTSTPDRPMAGTSINLSASTSGGSGTLQFVWSGLPMGCPMLDAEYIECAPSDPGTSTVKVAVTDAAGVTVVENLTLTVTSGSGLLWALGAGNGLAVVALGVVAAALAATAAVVVWRRRRGPEPDASDDEWA